MTSKCLPEGDGITSYRFGTKDRLTFAYRVTVRIRKSQRQIDLEILLCNPGKFRRYCSRIMERDDVM